MLESIILYCFRETGIAWLGLVQFSSMRFVLSRPKVNQTKRDSWLKNNIDREIDDVVDRIRPQQTVYIENAVGLLWSNGNGSTAALCDSDHGLPNSHYYFSFSLFWHAFYLVWLTFCHCHFYFHLLFVWWALIYYIPHYLYFLFIWSRPTQYLSFDFIVSLLRLDFTLMEI